MPTTGTSTVREIVQDALRKIGVLSVDEAAEADTYAHALRQLGRMLKAWQNRGYYHFTYTSGTLTLTTAASYTLDPVRPFRIVNARLKRSGIEIPMQELTRDEYDALPQKDSTGLPTTYYYNRQREAAQLFIWPVLATADGETIEYTYEREISDIDGDDEIDVPGEWYDAVVYGLGARLVDDFSIVEPLANRVIARARDEFEAAIASDREASIYFGADY